VVTCEEPCSFQDVARTASGLVQRMDQMLRQLNEVVERVNRQVFDESTLSNVSLVVRNLRQASESAVTMIGNVNRVVETNAPAVATSLSNLVAFSSELTQFSADLRQTVNTNKDEVEVVLKNLGTASSSFTNLTADLQAGKGLLGTLLKDEKMKDDMTQTLSNLTMLSSNLNKYGLLYKPKPPKTSASSKYPSK